MIFGFFLKIRREAKREVSFRELGLETFSFVFLENDGRERFETRSIYRKM